MLCLVDLRCVCLDIVVIDGVKLKVEHIICITNVMQIDLENTTAIVEMISYLFLEEEEPGDEREYLRDNEVHNHMVFKQVNQ